MPNKNMLTHNKLRFAVGGNGYKYSSIWSVFAHNCNVYILSRNIGHAVKLSLHGDNNSLICQLAYTDQWYNTEILKLDHTLERSIVRWKRKFTPMTELAHVVSIKFPTQFLNGPPISASRKKPIFLLSPETLDSQTEVGVFYTKMSPDQAEFTLAKSSSPIGWFALPNGDNVCVAVRLIKQETYTLSSGVTLTDGTEVPLNPQGWTVEHKKKAARLSYEGSFKSIFFNEPGDGDTLQLIEMGGMKFHHNNN